MFCFTVTPGPNATLPTYRTNVSVVSTEPKEIFPKRVVNSTESVSIYCKIATSSSSQPSVKWLMNKKELTLADRGREDTIIGINTEKDGDGWNSTLTVKKPSEY